MGCFVTDVSFLKFLICFRENSTDPDFLGKFLYFFVSSQVTHAVPDRGRKANAGIINKKAKVKSFNSGLIITTNNP